MAEPTEAAADGAAPDMATPAVAAGATHGAVAPADPEPHVAPEPPGAAEQGAGLPDTPAPPSAPPVPPHVPRLRRLGNWLVGGSPWAATLGWGVAVLGCAGAAAWVLRNGLGLAASAAGWLTVHAAKGSALEDGAAGVALRALGRRLGWEPAAALSLVHSLAAAALLLAVMAAAARARGQIAAVLAAVVVVAWPASREVLAVASVETFLALATLGVAVAAGLGAVAPRASVVVGATSLTVLLVSHPVGAAAAVALAVGLALWPGPAAPTEQPGLPDEAGIETRPLWVGWLATVSLALAALALVMAPDGVKPWFVQTIGALRSPAPEPQLGLIAGLPVVGPWVALAGRLPMALLLFALPAAAGALRERSRAEAPVTGALVLWLALAGVLGHPVPGTVDLAAVVAPLLVVLAVCGFVDVAGQALGSATVAARVATAGLIVAAAGALVADARLQRIDGRTLLGRVPGLLAPAAALQPATLHADEIALLYRHEESTALQPARPGGAALGAALRVLHPALAGVSYGHAQDANLVLVPGRPLHAVDRALTAAGTRVVCTATGLSCLVRLRGQQVPAP